MIFTSYYSYEAETLNYYKLISQYINLHYIHEQYILHMYQYV